jgi:hypothetical protein
VAGPDKSAGSCGHLELRPYLVEAGDNVPCRFNVGPGDCGRFCPMGDLRRISDYALTSDPQERGVAGSPFLRQ